MVHRAPRHQAHGPGAGAQPLATSSPIAGAVALDRCNTLLHKTLLRGSRWAFPARLPANRGPVRTCSGSAPVWADWTTLFTSRNRVLEARAKICVHLEIALAAPYAADFVLHFATMARFRSPEINHRHSSRLCADQPAERESHPAARLMDLGRGSTPYTRSPIAVRGSPP
jgi:hypothetical protein